MPRLYAELQCRGSKVEDTVQLAAAMDAIRGLGQQSDACNSHKSGRMRLPAVGCM